MQPPRLFIHEKIEERMAIEMLHGLPAKRLDDLLRPVAGQQLGGDLGKQPHPFRGLFPLDRVMDRPQQHRGLGLALHQVILGAVADGLDRQRLVLQTRQNEDRQMRRGGVDPLQRGQPHAVGQAQIEQDGIDRRPCFKHSAALRQPIDMDDLQAAVNLGQHLLQQIRIGRDCLPPAECEDRLYSWCHSWLSFTAN